MLLLYGYLYRKSLCHKEAAAEYPDKFLTAAALSAVHQNSPVHEAAHTRDSLLLLLHWQKKSELQYGSGQFPVPLWSRNSPLPAHPLSDCRKCHWQDRNLRSSLNPDLFPLLLQLSEYKNTWSVYPAWFRCLSYFHFPMFLLHMRQFLFLIRTVLFHPQQSPPCQNHHCVLRQNFLRPVLYVSVLPVAPVLPVQDM